MSKKEIKKTEKSAADTIVEDSIAVLQSRNIIKDKLIDELQEKLKRSDDELIQLKELAYEQLKAELVADIEPRYTVPKELLVLMSIDELKQIQVVLDKSPVQVIKSGTPIMDRKTKPRQMLDSKFAKAQALRMGGN